MLIKFSPYLIAMLIGLMIGVERERRWHSRHQAMGVRTFLLLALIGAIAAGIDQPLVSLGMVLFAGAASLIGYVQVSKLGQADQESVGLTTEIAAMATFGLGYLAGYEPLLSLALGVIMLLVLQNKTAMHTLALKRLRQEEIQAAAVLLLLAVGVVPLIPDRTIDPLGIFNLYTLALMVALIAGIQFASYAASRIFGQQIGVPLSGFLAGAISSTAAFATYPKLARSSEASAWSIAAAAAFANAAKLVLVTVLLSAISWHITFALILPLSLMTVASLAAGGVFARKKVDGQNSVEPKNPLHILSAIKIGALLTALIFVVELSQRFFGEVLTKVITFLGAMFELHGVAVAGANMYNNGTIDLLSSAKIILIAISASMLSKVLITSVLGRGKYRAIILMFSVGMFLLSVACWLLAVLVPAFIIGVG